MRTAGVIAEYNPFHNGHAFQFDQIRKAAEADYIIVVMSPDFVQRGECAVLDKYTRAKAALLCGADLILELPAAYATGSAEFFAGGAVRILDSLHLVDFLCFGCEKPDLELLLKLSSVLSQEPDTYRKLLKANLAEGKTWPEAREEALRMYLAAPGTPCPGADDISDFLRHPNNILALEYCRALFRLSSSIRPLPLKRVGSSYHDQDLQSDTSICSAAALRAALKESAPSGRFFDFVPERLRDLYTDSLKYLLFQDDFLPLLSRSLLLSDASVPSVSTGDPAKDIYDFPEELENRFRNLRWECIGRSWDDVTALLKTRHQTAAHIRRALLHRILEINERTVRDFSCLDPLPYVRVLGFRKSAAPLLHQIKKSSRTLLLTKYSAAASLLADCPEALRMLQTDQYASHIYRSTVSLKYGRPFVPEYRISPVVV